MPPFECFECDEGSTEMPDPSTVAKKARKVRFHPDDRLISVDKVPEEGKEFAWWTPKEFMKLRISAKLIVKELRRIDDGQALQEADHAYSAVRIVSAADLSEEEHQALLINPSKLARGAEKFARRNLTGRGFERYISPAQKKERGVRAAEVRRSVVCMSNEKASQEEISSYYHTQCRFFHLLSRMNGHADEQAARDVFAAALSMDTALRKAVTGSSDDFSLPFVTSKSYSGMLGRQTRQSTLDLGEDASCANLISI